MLRKQCPAARMWADVNELDRTSGHAEASVSVMGEPDALVAGLVEMARAISEKTGVSLRNISRSLEMAARQEERRTHT